MWIFIKNFETVQLEITKTMGLALNCLDAANDLSHLVINVAALVHVFGDLLLGIHHSGVVTAAKQLANLRQRQIGLLAADIHGNLAG